MRAEGARLEGPSGPRVLEGEAARARVEALALGRDEDVALARLGLAARRPLVRLGLVVRWPLVRLGLLGLGLGVGAARTAPAAAHGSLARRILEGRWRLEQKQLQMKRMSMDRLQGRPYRRPKDIPQ